MASLKLPAWIRKYIRNYYLMTALAFVVWMLFFDSNNMLVQWNNRKELHELLEQKAYYEEETARNRAMVKELTNPDDQRALEKFGREKYLMKRESEVIYLIIPETETSAKEKV